MRAEANRARRRAWAETESRRLAFAEVARAAASIGVPVVPVKGVLTALTLYADASDRPMVDIDVRVRGCDQERLTAAVAARGGEVLERSRAYASVALRVRGERVELESHVGPPGYCALSVDAMIARGIPSVDPFGAPHVQPEAHHHALLLMVNAFKDQLVCAGEGALEDLARLSALPGFSVERLAHEAREARVATLASIVARWMVDERGVARWRKLADALEGRAHRRVYAAAFRARARPRVQPTLALRLLARAAPDSAAMRAQSMARMFARWVEERLTEPFPDRRHSFADRVNR